MRHSPAANEIQWDPAQGKLDPAALSGIEAVVHLSGANIADGRFTEARKREITESRVLSTRLISETLAKVSPKPAALICASAIGFYGNRGDEQLDETSAPGTGFLAEVCTAWEASADPARAAGVRVCHVRVGVVLTTQGGALKELLTPFKLGVGGRIGDGRQGMSWITYQDILDLFQLCLERSELSGPVNGTAPNPASNAEFTKTLGAVLHRPTIFPLPAAVIRGLFGEMGQVLLLDGAYVHPRVAERVGHRFRYTDLASALRHEITGDTAPPRG